MGHAIFLQGGESRTHLRARAGLGLRCCDLKVVSMLTERLGTSSIRASCLRALSPFAADIENQLKRDETPQPQKKKAEKDDRQLQLF